ncbi:MAG TPA: hypothetical protein VFQ60_00345, partial [Patescibacteria group bacterium]|nr:hypothetical protein [Patescibacteria group bacterium]
MDPKLTSSFRLRTIARFWRYFRVGRIDLLGKQNLNLIPADKRVIIAVSHLTDFDMPAVISQLATQFDLIIANTALHHNFFQKPFLHLAMQLADKKNFLPVRYRETANHKKLGAFDSADFERMRSALERGKTLVIAAHNPAHGQLPPSGYGAAYLHQITPRSIILPVSVCFSQTPSRWNRANARITIQTPITLSPILHIERFAGLSGDYHQSRNRMGQEEERE